jgi:hypothetical protein
MGGTTVLTDDGAVAIDMPSDRKGTFERGWSRSLNGGLPASTTRFWRLTHAG